MDRRDDSSSCTEKFVVKNQSITMAKNNRMGAEAAIAS
jgi:hypothetical protein